MSAHGDPAAVERELLGYAAKAMAKGLVLIYGAFEGVDGRERAGVCALGAYNATAGKDDRLSLPEDSLEDVSEFVLAWDAIEAGFDGDKCGDHPLEWWRVGKNLRRALRPRKAKSS